MAYGVGLVVVVVLIATRSFKPAYRSREHVAAVAVVAEHVHRRRGGGEQDRVAGARHRQCLRDNAIHDVFHLVSLGPGGLDHADIWCVSRECVARFRPCTRR